MALKYHEDWQSSKKTVLQRNAYMFDNELMSDVSFTCGELSRIFHAHKYVLATSSAVFFAMFYGNLAQKEFPTHLESFKEFLCFLYTNNCKIRAKERLELCIWPRRIYCMWSLAKKCYSVLEANIEPDNVFTVLEQAMYLDKKLETKCWDMVIKETLKCLNSEAFCNIGPHTLNILLKNRSLQINEVDLL